QRPAGGAEVAPQEEREEHDDEQPQAPVPARPEAGADHQEVAEQHQQQARDDEVPAVGFDVHGGLARMRLLAYGRPCGTTSSPVGQAFQPDGVTASGWKARPTFRPTGYTDSTSAAPWSPLMTASLRALLSGIIDYAGLFPPEKLPLEQAV